MKQRTTKSGPLPQSLPLVATKPDIPLQQAAKDGREDVVRQWMVVDKSGVDALDSQDYTAFHYAAKYHRCDVMRILVDNGADPKNLWKGESGLHLVAWCSPKPSEQESQAIKESMKYLLEELKLDVNQSTPVYDQSPLHYACSNGNKAAVEVLLDQENIQLDLKGYRNDSILHASCRTDNVELLQLVLEKLEEKRKLSHLLPLKDRGSLTALGVALTSGHLQMANKLLEFARNDEFTEIDPHLVLDNTQGKETDALIEFLSTCNLKHLSCRSDGASILHMVSEKGWGRAVKEIAIKEPSLLNEKECHHYTPLHYAAAKNNSDIVELLMNQNNAQVDAIDKDGCTPLLVAARHGSTDAFSKLLEKADAHKMSKDGKNAVFLAAESDHSAILEAAQGKDPSIFRQADHEDCTPLHAAAANGSERALKILLDQHVDVNVRNKQSQTPLHLAAANGHNSVIETLLAYVPRDGESSELATVDISARDEFFNTALHEAPWSGHISVAATLLNKGASVRARNKFSQTPLHGAAGGGHQELVELLISEHDAEVNVKDQDQQVPLHYAAQTGHPGVVTTLLDHGADLTAVDGWGKMTALEVSIELGNHDVAKAVVDHGNWKTALRHTYRRGFHGEGQLTTPMRSLITDVPEVALEVLKKCTTVYGSGEGFKNYKVVFDYEFLEDLGEPESAAACCGSSAEANNATSISQHKGVRKYRPSYLLNRLVPRVCKSKKEGQYTTWGPAVFDKATYPLQLMIDNNRTELLNHPLVSTLLDYKWKRTWPLYIANVFFYLVFLSFLTAYALVIPNPQSELCFAGSFSNVSAVCLNNSNASQCGTCGSNQPFLYAAGAIVLLCVLVRVIMEFIQFLEQPAHYFLNRENWLELFLYSFTVTFMSTLGRTCLCPKPWQWQIGALAVFLAWIHLSIFVRKLPQLGLYIIMFEDIVLTFIKLAIPALLLVLAFSMAFYMMFFVPSPLFAASPFATPGLSIIKAMTMAVGEMDFETIFRFTSGGVGDIDEVPTPIPYTGVSILLWIFFLILMPILLMNLLTGLAVGDVDRIQSTAEYRKLELQIELVLKMEEAFQAFRTWFIPPHDGGTKKIKILPNEHCHRKRFLSLLAGVDKHPTGEDISKSLSNPIKNIEIDHVHQHTTTLLAKVAEQGTEQKDVIKLGTEQRKEVAALKNAMVDQATEVGNVKAIVTDLKEDISSQREEMGDLQKAIPQQSVMMKTELIAAMDEQRSEISDLKTAVTEQRAQVSQLGTEMGILKTAMAGQREEQSVGMGELRTELKIVSQRMEKLLELWAQREGMDTAGTEEKEGDT